MKKILVCEDDETLIKVIKYIFSKYDIEIKFVITGDDLYAAAKKESPDLILLDYMLPGKDGLKVLDELKNDRSLQQIPIVMLSAVETERIIESARLKGIKDYIIKPFVAEDLRKKVLGYLGLPEQKQP